MGDAFGSLTTVLRSSKKTILLVIITAMISIAVSVAISTWLGRISNLRVPSLGTIHTLGVEAYGGDIKLKDGEQYVDWGTIFPGTSIDCSFYMRSMSNIEIVLILDTANWTFRDSEGRTVSGYTNDYMNLTWNYTETLIDPGEVVMVTLTLSASGSYSFIDYLVTNDVRDFSFDIVIRASEVY